MDSKEVLDRFMEGVGVKSYGSMKYLRSTNKFKLECLRKNVRIVAQTDGVKFHLPLSDLRDPFSVRNVPLLVT